MSAPLSTTNTPELSRDQLQAILVLPLTQKSVFLAAGPRIFDVTAAGPVRIPKLISQDAPGWFGENEEIDEVDTDVQELVLLDGIKSLKSITRYSNELARSSVIALDAALRDKMVLECANKIDAAFIAGTGDPVSGKNTTPLGIINYAGTQSIAAVGVISIDDLHDAVGLALGANADVSSMRWFMTSQIWSNLRKLKTTQGQYLIQPDPQLSGTFQLLGLPVDITNRIPSNLGTAHNETNVILFDPAQVAVARDLAPSVKLLDQTYAAFDQQAIRVVAHYDAGPLNEQAIVILRGVTG